MLHRRMKLRWCCAQAAQQLGGSPGCTSSCRHYRRYSLPSWRSSSRRWPGEHGANDAFRQRQCLCPNTAPSLLLRCADLFVSCVHRYIPLQAIGDRLLGQLEVQRWGECRVSLQHHHVLVTSCGFAVVQHPLTTTCERHCTKQFAVTGKRRSEAALRQAVCGIGKRRSWLQGTLLGLLAAYNYEAGILAAAARLLGGDAARDLAAAYRSRLRGRSAAVSAATSAASGSPTAGSSSVGNVPPTLATGLGAEAGGGGGPEAMRRKMALLELS